MIGYLNGAKTYCFAPENVVAPRNIIRVCKDFEVTMRKMMNNNYYMNLVQVVIIS